ncbi:MAG: hypothetical protein KZQ60_18600 [Candidatus Thiodiazotropha sp. (ex Lucinoma aequizonata)]|nr:hypothetical protein [Candidatus Thiodiazotropha sp. (ex Lucinoma aequizonata)]MCU7887252.1 hypothetical protein [Candidatus Thiodiazotropha sp. (ex Lucinoma aequizonata)]MCU7908315.1 hypothetical protein [Candidatus Thiodiazotropha sp. (ex Lucinoma aequizonata)]
MTDCNTTTTQTIVPKIAVRYRLKLPNGEEVIRRYLGFFSYSEWEDQETKKFTHTESSRHQSRLY